VSGLAAWAGGTTRAEATRPARGSITTTPLYPPHTPDAERPRSPPPRGDGRCIRPGACKDPVSPRVDRAGGRGGALIEEAELAAIAEERVIVDRLQRGDRAAAATLYGWYGDSLFREVIAPRLPIREEAEDVLRDTFRLVLERIHQYHPEENKSIYFWLRRIAINRVVDTHRATQRTRRLEAAVEAEERVHGRVAEPDDSVDQDDSRGRIEAALQKLNPRYAEALRMRLLEEVDREECARRMGVTLGNFDVILHRASASFRKAYQPEP